MFVAMNGRVESAPTGRGSIHWQVSTFEQLSVHQLYRMIQLRVNVFVVEQNCPYPELDDQDQTAWHLHGYIDGELAAYARLLPPNAEGRPGIGRVIVAADFRGAQLGEALMQAAMNWVHDAFPGAIIEIGAQWALRDFYQRLGFVAVGEPYDEDGIQHVKMLFSPVAA